MKTTTTVTGSLIEGVVHAVAACSARAQSSILLFGTVGARLTCVSNGKDQSAVTLCNSNNIPNFWGLRGSEDLGGGTKALFLLMDQYDLGIGAIIDNSSGLFARNAYVGLSNDRWGSPLTGQQYDFMYDSLTAKVMETGSLYTGFFNYRRGPFAALNAANLHLAPAWSLGGDYQYVKCNAQLSDNSVHQLADALRYSLSKRTLVYAETVYQRARGDNAHVATNALCGPACVSVSRTESLATLGPSMHF